MNVMRKRRYTVEIGYISVKIVAKIKHAKFDNASCNCAGKPATKFINLTDENFPIYGTPLYSKKVSLFNNACSSNHR